MAGTEDDKDEATQQKKKSFTIRSKAKASAYPFSPAIRML